MKNWPWVTPLSVATLVLLAILGPACQQEAGASGLLSRIKARAAEAKDELILIRREIHMNPEISGMEEQTAALIAQHLRRLDLRVETGVGGHGVVGVLDGGRPGPVVAYRADMDAVPSQVVGDPPYRSRVPGVKHVCGHDAHVAVGLGVAEVLASIREDLPGTVKFIFQPAEENVAGARAMIEDGVLEDPSPEAIFAVHTAPLEVGVIGCPLGVGLAGWDSFQVRLESAGEIEKITGDVVESMDALSTVAFPAGGEGFSTMMNNLTVEDGPYADFIYIRASGPASPDDGTRVIKGEIRASGPDAYARARGQIQDALTTATTKRGSFELTFADERFPDMHSDPELVQQAVAPIEAALGTGSTVTMYATAPFFGEDFALFQQHIPGAMFFLGVANEEKSITAYNHFPAYDIDEAAIEIGTVAMANVLRNYLESH